MFFSCVWLVNKPVPTVWAPRSVWTDVKYKVVQIWPGQTVTCLHTISPGHIWTTLYLVLTGIFFILCFLSLYFIRTSFFVAIILHFAFCFITHNTNIHHGEIRTREQPQTLALDLSATATGFRSPEHPVRGYKDWVIQARIKIENTKANQVEAALTQVRHYNGWHSALPRLASCLRVCSELPPQHH